MTPPCTTRTNHADPERDSPTYYVVDEATSTVVHTTTDIAEAFVEAAEMGPAHSVARRITRREAPEGV